MGGAAHCQSGPCRPGRPASAAAAKFPFCFACPAAERELLLSFKAGITNWEEVQAAWGLVGWTECTATDCTPVCSWTGVKCDPYHIPNSHVTQL